eukprot:2025133-Alexandrium_andersonii.AAC.1
MLPQSSPYAFQRAPTDSAELVDFRWLSQGLGFGGSGPLLVRSCQLPDLPQIRDSVGLGEKCLPS